MKIKIVLKTLTIVFCGLFLLTSSVQATEFSDNFNDGNANGWELGYTLGPPLNIGNWRVEDETLVQDSGFDGVLALVENLQVSDQTTEAQLKLNGPSGGGGIVIWFQDTANFAYIVLSNGRIEVAEVINGVWTSTLHDFTYSVNENRWVDLKVEANSSNGNLGVYADDNLLFTDHLNTLNRVGQSGLVHGNAGGYFDNFNITYPDLSPLNASIDIRPWSKLNIVNYRDRGVLPVAIFSTIDFNAERIDKKSLTFGVTGDEQSLAFCDHKLRDVDRDGSKDDLVCYFFVKKTGFACGNSQGILKGIENSETSFEGRDFVRVMPCG